MWADYDKGSEAGETIFENRPADGLKNPGGEGGNAACQPTISLPWT